MIARGLKPLVLVGLLGCQGAPDPREIAACDTDPPAEGEVLAGEIVCSDQLVTDGEGRGADYLLRSHWLRAVVRHPLVSLTAVGVGGGTIVDVAPWGQGDRVHEIVPLVDDGWLDVDTFHVEDGRIVVGGVVAALPDRPAIATGERREVAWSLSPDGPWLELEGADGLYLHGRGELELLDGQLWSDTLLVAHDGTAIEDGGGAIRAYGASRLLVAPPIDAVGHLSEQTQPLSGTAAGAARLVLVRGGERVGLIGLGDDGRFDLQVPSDVDAVRAEAPGFGPSAEVPPGADLDLVLGGEGTVAVSLDWVSGGWAAGAARPVAVSWSDAIGRSGRVVLPAEGGEIPLGEGRFDLAVEAGPDVVSRIIDLEIGANEQVELTIAPEPKFAAGSHVLLALPWHGDRSRSWRGTDAVAIEDALAAGARYAVFAPEDEVGGAGADPLGWLHVKNGSRLVSPDGFEIVAWPISASSREAGHGAVAPAGLSPEAAIAAIGGRYLAVDLGWLEQVPSPWQVEPRPDFVRLEHPGADPALTWAAWFRWLDAAEDLVPVGPLTWTEVGDPEVVASVDIEDGLIRGRVSSGSGPLLTIDALGRGPGETASGGRLPLRVAVRGAVMDEVRVLGDGGRTIARLTPVGEDWEELVLLEELPDRYVVVVAWSEQAWAVSGPLWLRAP